MKIEVYSPTIRRKEMDAVLSVLVEEKIGPGEQSERLVQMAKESLQFDYSLALRSPVTALSVAISLFKSENTGDAVLISALSPRYYQNVITDLGMVPVISDVDPSSGCVTSELINSAIEKSGANVRCIVLHHTLGFIPEMYSILDINLPLIEDCSASYGAVFDGKKAGTFGTLTILGLEERDMLTAGGGAMLFAMERRNASVLRQFANLPPEYALPDMNAAMALVQFREAAKSREKRSEIARLYTDAAMRGRHKLFSHSEKLEYNNYAFPLVLETGMKDVEAYAKRKEIVVESAFAGSLVDSACPNAYSLSLRTVLFPIYPRLGSENASKVAKLIQTLP